MTTSVGDVLWLCEWRPSISVCMSWDSMCISYCMFSYHSPLSLLPFELLSSSLSLAKSSVLRAWFSVSTTALLLASPFPRVKYQAPAFLCVQLSLRRCSTPHALLERRPVKTCSHVDTHRHILWRHGTWHSADIWYMMLSEHQQWWWGILKVSESFEEASDRKLCEGQCVCMCVQVFKEQSFMIHSVLICLLYSPPSHLSSVPPCLMVSSQVWLGFQERVPLTNVYFSSAHTFRFLIFSSLSSLVLFLFHPNTPLFFLSFFSLSFSPLFFLYWPILYPAQWLLRSAVPCCSYQFERMFGTCRIPGTLTGSIYIFTQ